MTFKISQVSTYALNQTQTYNSLSLQQKMADLQRQIATGVKGETYAEYGVQSQMIQSYRVDLESASSYIDNIDISRTGIAQMDRALTQLKDQLEIVIGQAMSDPQEGQPNVEVMQSLAHNAREILLDVMSNKSGGRYLFAGADVLNKPYNGYENLDLRVQQEMADWKDQNQTAQDLLNNIKGLTQSQMGYGISIQSAGNITARATETFEVDYTVKANEPPFVDALQALTIFIELDMPEEGVDLANRDEFYEIHNEATDMIVRAVRALEGPQFKLANADQALGRERDLHLSDRASLLKLMEFTEGVDQTSVITQFKALEVQLEASYQSTAIASRLSLARFI
jgi:flagellin-like hook-associated protein FlgL